MNDCDINWYFCTSLRSRLFYNFIHSFISDWGRFCPPYSSTVLWCHVYCFFSFLFFQIYMTCCGVFFVTNALIESQGQKHLLNALSVNLKYVSCWAATAMGCSQITAAEEEVRLCWQKDLYLLISCSSLYIYSFY